MLPNDNGTHSIVVVPHTDIRVDTGFGEGKGIALKIGQQSRNYGRSRRYSSWRHLLGVKTDSLVPLVRTLGMSPCGPLVGLLRSR